MPFGKKSIADDSRLAESEVAGVAAPSGARTATPAPTPAKSRRRSVQNAAIFVSAQTLLARADKLYP